MFKVNNNDSRKTSNVIPMSLLLALNIFHSFSFSYFTPFPFPVSIIYFEQLNICWMSIQTIAVARKDNY